MSSHADTIRRVLDWPITRYNATEHAAALAALDALLAENQRLREWDEATWPLTGALAIYGEGASLPALVEKAQEIVAAREALAGDAE